MLGGVSAKQRSLENIRQNIQTRKKLIGPKLPGPKHIEKKEALGVASPMGFGPVQCRSGPAREAGSGMGLGRLLWPRKEAVRRVHWHVQLSGSTRGAPGSSSRQRKQGRDDACII